jgi:hypothetical protein
MELNALVYNQCTLALRDNPNDQAFCIYVYNSQTVERLTQTPYLDAIKLDARRLGYSTVCIYEWGDPEPYRIRAKPMTQQPQIITPAFFAAAGWVSPVLWNRLGKLLEQPDVKKGITRASDKRQLYVTQAAASAIKTTAESASQRKATDYIYLPDLEEIDQIINQQGTQTDGVTVRYRATLNGTLATDPKAVWGWFAAQTQVFEDDFRVFYRESEIIDIAEAVTPPSLTTV